MPRESHTTENLLHRLRGFYGAGRTQTSEWIEVQQHAMDTFAEATRDPDWMHIDPVRAGRESPFASTIAFGFWTLGMLTYFQRSISGAEYPPGVKYGFNYGLNRVRLPNAIPVGSHIRCHMRLLDIEVRDAERFLVRSENTVEIRGQEKPALVAEWLVMLVT